MKFVRFFIKKLNKKNLKNKDDDKVINKELLINSLGEGFIVFVAVIVSGGY